MSKRFSSLIERILAKQPDLTALRASVEKEVLHYEIFRALSEKRLLNDITFQGGTALRLCYGSDRLSEDIDFAGGRGFAQTDARALKTCVEEHLLRTYGLEARVKEPEFSVFTDDAVPGVGVGKWSISIRTSDNVAEPQQRIKLEIATVPAHTRDVVALRANYEHIQQETTPLVPVESRAEILADKAVAFPMSLKFLESGEVDIASARIRHRDIWDMAALKRAGVKVDPKLVFRKVEDYSVTRDEYLKRLRAAVREAERIVSSPLFEAQMRRFVPEPRLAEYLGETGRLAALVGPVRDVLGVVGVGTPGDFSKGTSDPATNRSVSSAGAPKRAAPRGRSRDDDLGR